MSSSLHHDAGRPPPPGSPSPSLAVTDSSGAWGLRRADGTFVPAPPFDIDIEDLDFLEQIDGLDVGWAATTVHESLGYATIAYRVVSGRVVDLTAVASSNPPFTCDVQFVFPYERLLRFRLGEVESVNLLAPPAQILGEIEAAMSIAGLVDERWSRIGKMSPDEYRMLL